MEEDDGVEERERAYSRIGFHKLPAEFGCASMMLDMADSKKSSLLGCYS